MKLSAGCMSCGRSNVLLPVSTSWEGFPRVLLAQGNKVDFRHGYTPLFCYHP